jgi:alpha-N-arabinofuranosidase
MSVIVLLDEPIGTIHPTLYGQFTEHLGGVIYDGIWVGPDSKIPNVDGIRRSLIEHVRRLGRVVVRWPGGCFADKYHWRDGIGPRDKRPRRFGRWREETEPNHFGTREFMRFCRLCGVQPYFAANVGTGSAEEFQEWVEYCNAPAGRTTLADKRVSNGDREPFGVRYWGVGNESWGCGGKFTPEDYCTEYRRFTEWVPHYGVPLYLVAAGPEGNNLDWTRRFFKKWTDFARAPLHGWAPHYYCGTTGHALKFSTDQWYEMLDKGNQMEKLITDQWAVMKEFDPEHKVKLVVDEWGCWHPAGTEINRRHLFEQMSTLRDALVAALTLDTFNRHAEKVHMANVAQLVNNLHSLFLADGDRFVATPNFHVFEMYRPHQGARAVRLDVQAPEVAFRAGGQERRLFRIAGSASRGGEGLTVTLVHSHASEPAEVAIRLRGGSADRVRQTVLTHRTLNAHNTFDRPAEVVPKASETELRGATLHCVLAPASVTRLDVRLG